MKNTFSLKSKEDAVAQLLTAIRSDDWKQYFCISSEGIMEDYFISEENAALFSTITSLSTFFNEEEMWSMLRDKIAEIIPEIAEWIISGGIIFKKRFHCEKNIGYILRKVSATECKRIESGTVELTLLKDSGTKTVFGFYVAYFSPVAV